MAIPSINPQSTNLGRFPLTLHEMIQNGSPLSGLSSEWLKGQINRQQKKETPLTLAIQLKLTAVVKQLLEMEADPLLANGHGQTPLALAEATGEASIIDLFKTPKRKAETEENTSNKRQKTDLMALIETGDLDAVKKCVEEGKADLNETNVNGWTALHVAAFNNKVEIIKYLIQKEADCTAKTNNGEFPLFVAAYKGNLEAVRALIEEGHADIEAKNGPPGRTILHTVAGNGYVDILKYLFKKNVDIEARTKDSSATPLYVAAVNGKSEIVKLLIQNGADPKAKSGPLQWTASRGSAEKGYLSLSLYLSQMEKFSYKPPLFVAVEQGNLQALEKMVENGINIHKKYGPNEETLLHVAVRCNREDIIRYLIKEGADVKARTTSDKTPLFFAATNGKLAAVKVLVEEGNADIHEKQTSLGWNALHTAARYNCHEVIKYLLEQKADIETQSVTGLTPLGIAASNGHFETVKFLSEKNADINQRLGKEEWTPLHLATHHKQIKVVRYLIENGANIEATTKNEETPLYFAVGAESLPLVQLLIENKVDLEAKNGLNKETALHSAIECEDLAILEYLLRSGAQVDSENGFGCSALYYSSQGYGSLTAVNLLLQYNANIDKKNGAENQTALHAAVATGEIEIIKALMGQGADATIEAANGEKAIELTNDPNILSIFDFAQSTAKHAAELKLFHENFCKGAPLHLDELDRLARDHLKLWKNKNLLRPSDFKLFVKVSRKDMLALFERKEFQESLTNLIQTAQNTIMTADLDTATDLHSQLRKTLSLFIDLSPFLYPLDLQEDNKAEIQNRIIQLQNSLIQRKEQNASLCSKGESQEAKTVEEFEAKFAGKDLFALLAPFIADLPKQFEKEKSEIKYFTVFGVQMKEFWDSGLYEGVDLQTIGVDFLFNHYSERLAVDPKDASVKQELIHLIQRKLSLVQAVGAQKFSPSLLDDLSSLQKDLGDEHINPIEKLKKCHKELSLALIKTYVSKKRSLNGKAIHELLPKDKSQLDELGTQIALYQMPDLPFSIQSADQ